MSDITEDVLMAGDRKIPFDIRHRSILDSLPVWGDVKTILDVGCGHAPVSRRLQQIGYDVDALDLSKRDSWAHPGQVNFLEDDFTNTKKIKPSYNVVICSEVLEHLPDYKEFFHKLLAVTTDRLIITVPYERSFNEFGPPPIGHCNFWSLRPSDAAFTSIAEFITMSKPYSTSISKIRTKEKDVQMRQWCFLIVVDKRQCYG
jgi:SAM-dependent methyltransferase